MVKWDNVIYFDPDSKTDNWGDASKMKRHHIDRLDAFRDFLGKAIHVTSAWRPGDGKHPLGIATDIICPGMSLFDFYLKAERFGFGGIGVYPHWYWKRKNNIIGGLHVDSRRGHARWLCHKENGVQKYIALNTDNLKKYKVV